jgi:acyl-CoA synthetase (AMP-forming)/AMP-acid ligase II
VHEVAAIGVDDDEYGKRLKAFVVLEDGKEASEDDLKKYVKSNLAGYKVPREIVFLDELPRNATGKLLKRELQEKGEDAQGEAQDADQDEGASEAEAQEAGA